MTGRERVLALLRGEPVDRTPFMPITMMRAAEEIGVPYGRYALDHRVLVEAQLAIAARFGFDHVSAITETREARDCGAAIRYFDDQPYALDETESLLAGKTALERLVMPDPATAPAMLDRLHAITLLRQRAGAERIVEGWVEGPCGAAADLRGINRLMLDFHDDPRFVRALFEFTLGLGLRFGHAQAEAGSDIVGIGDPAASLAGPRVYREFIQPFQRRLVDGLHAAGVKVRLHICGNTRPVLGALAELGCEILDVDSVVPMEEARALCGPRQVLLGGIDPVRVFLHGTPAEVSAAAAHCRAAAGPRYILGAGCEVPPGTPEANLRALGRTVSGPVT